VFFIDCFFLLGSSFCRFVICVLVFDVILLLSVYGSNIVSFGCRFVMGAISRKLEVLECCFSALWDWHSPMFRVFGFPNCGLAILM